MTADLLAVLAESRALGFLGPGPVEDHLEHAVAFAGCVDVPPARALDLGAGGGLPGLVLAVTEWPGCRWTMLDAQTKRTEFLERAAVDLGIADRSLIVNERAELTGRSPEHRGAYDLVVARSFGAPAVTAECAAPLLRPGGRLVVSEPPSGSDQRWPAEGLAELGMRPVRAVVHDDRVHLMILERTDAPIDRYPRRVGIPAKRPVF